MNAEALTVGVIGLGAMGNHMARNLRAAGLLRAVWNRTVSVAAAFGDETGVAIATDPVALARDCGVLLTCVSADADLLEVIAAARPGIRPGTIVIDTSTVAAGTAREVAKQLIEVNAHLLDSPVSGGVEGARQGNLAAMVGGDADILEKARPVLDAIAGRVVHMGPTGAGQATKAVNQIMAAGINQAVTEALAFGEAEGLPMDRLIEVVGSGAAGNWFLDHRGPTMVDGSFASGFKLALHHKDLKICQAMAAARGVKLPVIETTLIHYQRLMAAGFGDEDISALYRSKREMFDSKPSS